VVPCEAVVQMRQSLEVPRLFRVRSVGAVRLSRADHVPASIPALGPPPVLMSMAAPPTSSKGSSRICLGAIRCFQRKQ